MAPTTVLIKLPTTNSIICSPFFNHYSSSTTFPSATSHHSAFINKRLLARAMRLFFLSLPLPSTLIPIVRPWLAILFSVRYSLMQKYYLSSLNISSPPLLYILVWGLIWPGKMTKIDSSSLHNLFFCVNNITGVSFLNSNEKYIITTGSSNRVRTSYSIEAYDIHRLKIITLCNHFQLHNFYGIVQL